VRQENNDYVRGGDALGLYLRPGSSRSLGSGLRESSLSDTAASNATVEQRQSAVRICRSELKPPSSSSSRVFCSGETRTKLTDRRLRERRRLVFRCFDRPTARIEPAPAFRSSWLFRANDNIFYYSNLSSDAEETSVYGTG